MALNELEVRDHLVAALREDLVGPMREDELIPERPSRWYLTGFLVPRSAPEEQRSDPLADEEVGGGPDTNGDDDRGDAPPIRERPIFPSSLGLSVIVGEDVTALNVRLDWGAYEPIEAEAAEALRTATLPAASEESDDPSDGSAPGPGPIPGRRIWQRTTRTEARGLLVADGRYELSGQKGVFWVVKVRDVVHPHLHGARAVSVFAVNDRQPEPAAATADRAYLFQVALSVDTEGGGILSRPNTIHEGSDDPDEARADLQYRDHGEWAVGHGVSVAVGASTTESAMSSVRTEWLPEAGVSRVKAHDVAGVPVDMEALAALPDGAALEAQMGPLLTAYAQWISDRATDAGTLAADRKDTADALLFQASGALERIRRGLALLRQDATAFEAFQLTNRAMALSAERARPGFYSPSRRPSWRLFQLAFLFLNVEGVSNPGHTDRETVDLLFFPTGGGKTEAYFGVAAFAMLLRRLRFRTEPGEGGGVAILLRYTLRLLTLDQLGRAATLTCALEMLRRADPGRLGTHRFAIGLWVGQKSTPNTLEDAEKQVRSYHASPGDPRRAPPMPLLGCPWCQTRFEVSSFDIEREKSRAVAFRVGCASYSCSFSFGNHPAGVPVVVVDEQIYRELPAFVIGTVDKFASLPWLGSSGMLFGKVRSSGPRGFYGYHERDPAAATRLVGGLRPPDLIIQDELHLITGPLGTMVGLYETVVDQLSTRDGQRPKIVASTATVRRASEQIRALYGRDRTVLFPPQGIGPDDTFFANIDRRPESTRRYVGVAAPGRSLKAIMVRVYSALLSAAYKDWRRGTPGRANPADTYSTLVAYFNTLRELGGAQRLVLEEVAPRAARLARRCALQDPSARYFRGRDLGLDVLELTSRQDTESIRQAKGRLEAPFGSPAGGKNDVLLASSMISVGVDISRLGLMVVNGQPRTVAEYIQASSRVGRETPGLVVTLHNLARPRDRSHYERFTAFHEAFYRMVEAASVTPFSSRAIDRGLAGVAVALARYATPDLAPNRGVEELDRATGVPEQVAKVLGRRARVHRSPATPGLEQHVENRVTRLMNDWSAIVASLNGVGAPVVYSPWETRGAGEPLLRYPTAAPSTKESRLDAFRAPTSMRDVEPSVHLWVAPDLEGDDT